MPAPYPDFSWTRADQRYAQLDPSGSPVLYQSTGDARYLPSLAQMSQLIKFQVAAGKVAAGTADAEIIVCGDSIGAGSYNPSYLTQPPVGSFVAKLVAELAAISPLGVMHGRTVVCPQANVGADPDARFAIVGDWVRGGLGFGDGSTMTSTTSGASTEFTFTPGFEAFDVADVIMLTAASGLGTVIATPTGAAGTTLNTGTGPAGRSTITITAASSSISNTIKLKHSAGGIVYMESIVTRRSASKNILVGNCCRPSSESSDWNQTGIYQSIESIKYAAPALTIFEIGENDARLGRSVADYITNMSALITAAQISGDVILITPPPSSDPVTFANQPAFVAAMKQLGATFGCPVFDFFSAFASTWQTTLMADSLHPNDYGHAKMARELAWFLRGCL